MFVRTTAALLLGLAATAASGGGPEIAYIKANGTAQEIYLVNPNGSGLTRVYAAPRKTGLGWLDLKPGGNELAFTEAFRITIQKFHDSGQPNGAAMSVASPCATATGNSAWHPDYHPSGDGSFVFVVACSGNFGIWQYTPGAALTQLFTTISTNRVRWNRTGTHLYYDEETSFNSAQMRLKRRDMATGTVEDLGPLSDLNSFEVTRTGDRLVFGSQLAVKLFDAATMSSTSEATDFCADGDDIHFSPDDARIVYETPHSAKGTYILVHASNCSGSPTSLTGKGEWHKKDWRQ